MFYADSLGRLGPIGEPIVVENRIKLDLVHLTAVPPWITTIKETLAEIRKFKKMIQEQPRLRLVTNQKELSTTIADKKIAVVLGMQNTPNDIMEGVGLSQLMKAGIRIISPCYDKLNDLGSGWLNTDIGLTQKGWCFLTDCATEGIIVDVSHCGHKTARNIVSCRKKDVLRFNLMASHGGCYSIHPNIRNLPDDVLKNVAEVGGIVGISTLTFTNDEYDNSTFPFIMHLSQAIDLCGEDLVCVGSDDLYVSRTVEEALQQYELISKKIDPDKTQRSRFPENPLKIMGPDMLEKLYESCLDHFPVKILEKIFGQNLLNFFKRALPAE